MQCEKVAKAGACLQTGVLNEGGLAYLGRLRDSSAVSSATPEAAV